MAGLVLTTAGLVLCPHAAPAMLVPSQSRVLVGGQPVVVLSDLETVAGCPLASALPPSPCITIGWLSGSIKLTVGGQPVVLESSMGLAKNPAQAPQGPPIIAPTQFSVMAS